MKAYLDVDPGFTQLWVEVCNSDMNLEGHDVFLTVGTTVNLPGALLPILGREWLSVFPPVVADYWRQKWAPPRVVQRTAHGRRLGIGTGILNWNGRDAGMPASVRAS